MNRIFRQDEHDFGGLFRGIAVALQRGLLILSLLLILSESQAGPTPFYGKFYNADGSPQTNVIQMQAWPPANNWTIYGTNMVYGGAIMNLVPDNTGYFSNAAYANTYRLLVTNLNSGFYMTLLDTTNFLSIAVYATDTPTVGNILNGFGIITNWLGYTPVPATYAGISNAFGFQVATNGNSSLSNTLATTFALYPFKTYAGISNAVGFLLATNTPASLSNTLASTFALYPLATYAGISNAIGFKLATNVTGLTSNQQFTANGVTNTAYFTNGQLQRISTP